MSDELENFDSKQNLTGQKVILVGVNCPTELMSDDLENFDFKQNSTDQKVELMSDELELRECRRQLIEENEDIINCAIITGPGFGNITPIGNQSRKDAIVAAMRKRGLRPVNASVWNLLYAVCIKYIIFCIHAIYATICIL